MNCHLCQEPKPESKPIKDNIDKSPVKRKEFNQEPMFDRKPNAFKSLRANNFNNSSSKRFEENQFNNSERKNNNHNNNSTNDSFQNNNLNERPIGAICNMHSNNSSFNQNNQIPFFQNANQPQQDIYMPNPINYNNSNDFYNPIGNNFDQDNMFQNNNNNMNFMPNNFPPLNNSNSNDPQNFPFFMNQIPNHLMMFPNNDNFNSFNVNQNLQSFSNFNQLLQSQMFYNNNNNPPMNFIDHNFNSEQMEYNNSNEQIMIVDYKKSNYNNVRENNINIENKYLNRKREADKLVEFEEITSKKYSGTGARNLEYIKIGDWICRKCDNINFSYRMKCHRCKSFFEEAGENINGKYLFISFSFKNKIFFIKKY